MTAEQLEALALRMGENSTRMRQRLSEQAAAAAALLQADQERFQNELLQLTTYREDRPAPITALG